MVKLGLNPGITTYAILLLSKEEIRCLKRNPLHWPILSVPSAKYNQHLTTSRHLYHYPTVLKVTITLCLDYSPYLPSGLPASSLTPLQSVFCSQSRPLKPSQITSFLLKLAVAPISLGVEGRALSVLRRPYMIQASTASDFISCYSSPFSLPTHMGLITVPPRCQVH